MDANRQIGSRFKQKKMIHQTITLLVGGSFVDTVGQPHHSPSSPDLQIRSIHKTGLRSQEGRKSMLIPRTPRT